ncbi:AAA family ATPase [Streptomyces graminilatus]|uniref:AAA family ATPase n=1 Tax=Streptomyces graminilatus TaxID=1464070 RepID=UPI000B0CC2B9|nr:ATP-binding protein [Streptomyces graminilatus]
MNDLGPSPDPASKRLVGRHRDLEFIRSFLGNAEVHGAALLLSGEAGVGKTAVLDAVTSGAAHNGVRVLRAAGVQFEADISYAGLNQLLVPLFDDFDILDTVHRDALRVAVGIGGGPAPDRLPTSTAVLLLLRLISNRTPLLLVVDDLPWLDRATNAVLGFVARRLVGSRVGFLAASRTDSDSSDSSDSFFEAGGLAEHRLEPLDDVSSAELLTLAHPGVSPTVPPPARLVGRRRRCAVVPGLAAHPGHEGHACGDRDRGPRCRRPFPHRVVPVVGEAPELVVGRPARKALGNGPGGRRAVTRVRRLRPADTRTGCRSAPSPRTATSRARAEPRPGRRRGRRHPAERPRDLLTHPRADGHSA